MFGKLFKGREYSREDFDQQARTAEQARIIAEEARGPYPNPGGLEAAMAAADNREAQYAKLGKLGGKAHAEANNMEVEHQKLQRQAEDARQAYAEAQARLEIYERDVLKKNGASIQV